MRPAPRPTKSAPSLSVLHFLASQSEQACFLNSITRPTAWQRYPRRGAQVALGTVLHVSPSIRRHFYTSPTRSASVESSLLNLDFLRPYPERESSKFALTGFPEKNACVSRYASTDTRPLWRRPWKDKLRKENPVLKTSVSPTLPSFLDDSGNTNLGRRKPVKGSNELKLRCTEFNENGDVTFMDGEFKKSELIAKVCPPGLECEGPWD